MRPATVLLTAAKVAVLLARCDAPFAARCRWPGQKATALKASALADRLQPVATATNRCPNTSDFGRTEVDAWNQPFLISCEPGNPIMVVVTSVGRDGVRGTADDIKRSAETSGDGAAPIERPSDADRQRDPAAADGDDAPDDEASLAQQDPATREASIKYLENTLPKFGWHFARGPRDAKLVGL